MSVAVNIKQHEQKFLSLLQGSPTCLHLDADPSTAGSTQRVGQVTQYADTGCHGRGCKRRESTLFVKAG